MRVFEIHDLTTGEILADNLTFNEVPELFEAYAKFYRNHELMTFFKELQPIKSWNKAYKLSSNNYHDFKAQWLDMAEEISCNLY